MAETELTTDNIGKYCRPFCKNLSRLSNMCVVVTSAKCSRYDVTITRCVDLLFFIRCQSCIDEGGDGLEWTGGAEVRCYETIDPGSGGGQ